MEKVYDVDFGENEVCNCEECNECRDLYEDDDFDEYRCGDDCSECSAEDCGNRSMDYNY